MWKGQPRRIDGRARTRAVILGPPASERTAVCRFGESNCRTRGPEPGFSVSTPNTEIGRRDSAARPDRSGVRRFGNAARKAPDVAPLLPDRLAQLRKTKGMGGDARHG